MAGVINLFGIIGDADPFFGGGGVSVSYVTEQLAALAGESEITVRISSYGGDVDQGETIYNLLKTSGKTIHVEIVGQCYSIATIIAMAGDTIKTAKNSRWMVHPAWTPYASGNADELEQIAASLRERSELLYGYYLARVPEEKRATLREYFDAEKEMTADEVIELGLADSLLTEVKDMTMPRFRAVAYIKPKNEPMDIMEKLDAMFAKWLPKNEAAPAIVAASIATDNGELYYDGDLTVGTAVFSDAEMTTPAADGAYTAGEQAMTVADGKVAEIVPVAVEPSDLDKANAKIDELTAALAAAKADLEAANAKAGELEASMNALRGELDEIKNMAVNLGKPKRAEVKTAVKQITAAGRMAEIQNKLKNKNK